MITKIELQQQLGDCAQVLKDIHLLNEVYQDRNMSVDEVANILLGLEYLYKLKFDKLSSGIKQLNIN